MRVSDSATVRRALRGDREAFQELVERHGRRLFGLAYRMTGNKQDAEDVVQETFIKAHNSMDRFELRADFWIDDQKLLPDAGDRVQPAGNQTEALSRSGLMQVADIDRFLQRLRSFASEHRQALLARFPDLTAEEKHVLGLDEVARGVVGQVSGGSAGGVGATGGAD